MPTDREFDTQQERLRSLSGDVLRRYQRELNTEISDKKRLAATYGAGFATSSVRRQAQVVATMATQMLHAPNAMVNVLGDTEQESIAYIKDNAVVPDEPAYTMPMSEAYCKNVIHTGREMAVDKSLEHPLVCDTHLAQDGVIVSYLGVPIANREQVIVGVLCVFESTERTWTSADVSILTQLSMVLTRALPD